MKKVFSTALALVMAVSLAACTSAPATTTAAPAATTAAPAATQAAAPAATEAAASDMLYTDPMILRFASGGSGGSDYTDIGTIISYLSEGDRLPQGSTLTQEVVSGGTSTSGYVIEAGMADICRGQNAISGTVGIGGRPPYSSINALFAAGGNSVCLQVVTEDFKKKTGYSTIEEIIANKYPANICSEDVGATDYILLQYVFEILGTSFEEFQGWGGTINFSGNDTGSEMMQDGSCDIMLMATTLTSSAVTELSMSTKIIVSGFSDQVVDELLKRGFAERTIPKDTFGAVAEDSRSCYIGTSLIVSQDMDEKMAYTLTKALMEGLDELSEICPTFRGMTLQTAVDKNIMVVPQHPGAIKYFQEIGILDENGNPKA